MSGGSPMAGAFLLFFFVALGVFIILWIALPFSVFGIKDKMDDLKKEVGKTNKLLEAILKERKIENSQVIKMPGKQGRPRAVNGEQSE